MTTSKTRSSGRSARRPWLRSTVKVLLLAVVAGAMLHVAGGVRAASDRSVAGTIVSQVTASDCTSPIGLCTAGEFRGGIQGRFEFRATSITPSADSPATGIVFYTGDLTVHTKDGDLIVKDAGVVKSTGGDVASVSTIVGGTASLARASGSIRISGTFQAGCVDCKYEGRLAVP